MFRFLMLPNTLTEALEKSAHQNFVMIDYHWKDYFLQPGKKLMEKLEEDPTAVICFSSANKNAMQNIRSMFVDLMKKGIKNPAIIICDSTHTTTDESLIHYSIEAGGLLLDGFCDGVCFGYHYGNTAIAPAGQVVELNCLWCFAGHPHQDL